MSLNGWLGIGLVLVLALWRIDAVGTARDLELLRADNLQTLLDESALRVTEQSIVISAQVAAMADATEAARLFQSLTQTIQRDGQATRQTLAECYSITQISRAFLDQCIVKHTAGELSAMEASMAKYWCTDKENEVVDKCLQLHGGYGYMNEYPIARMFVDARVQRIYGGTNEIMKEVIARSFS